MITCPACGYERNIDGTDECERCQSPLNDLARPHSTTSLEKSIFQDRIFALSPKKPLVVSPDTTVGETLRLLAKSSVGCALIMRGEELLGIFTERDALWRISDQADILADRPIADYMTTSPQTLEITDKIAFALRSMDQGGYHHLAIRTDGRVTGLITAPDVMRYITEKLSNAGV